MKKEKKPVYCMHCKRWYANTRVNQCDLPAGSAKNNPNEGVHYIETTPIATNVVGFNNKSEGSSYGFPSKLNRNNDCEYYKGLRFLGKLLRRINWKIPMKSTIDLEERLVPKNKNRNSIETIN